MSGKTAATHLASLVTLACLTVTQAKRERPAPPPAPKTPWEEAVEVLTLRAPGSLLVFACGYAFWIALKVRATGPRGVFWGVSFLRVLIGGFGGGICVPLCLGKPVGPYANDVVVTAALFGWYLSYRSPMDVAYKYFHHEGIKELHVWMNLIFEVFRSNFIVTCVILANSTLKPSLFHLPLWGPLLAGSMAGSFGQFLPFDKGLAPVEHGFNWLMMSAFTVAAFVHTVLHEPEYGPLVWSVVAPGMDRTESSVRLVVIFFLSSVAVLQHYIFGPQWHPLMPVTRLLSAVVPAYYDEPIHKSKLL